MTAAFDSQKEQEKRPMEATKSKHESAVECAVARSKKKAALDALMRYVDGDSCDCEERRDDPEWFPCHHCQGYYVLYGKWPDLADMSSSARGL